MMKVLLMLLALCAFAFAAFPEVNEYKTSQCTGSPMLKHKGSFFKDIAMDDGAASVKIEKTGHKWLGFTDKAEKGECAGKDLGTLSHRCINLDDSLDERIKCIRLV